MNFDQARLEESWMVELHPLGASRIRQVRDVLKEKREMLARGERPEWEEVAVRESFNEAKKELAKIRREMREQSSAVADKLGQVKQPCAQEQAGNPSDSFQQPGDPIRNVVRVEKLPNPEQDQQGKPVGGGQTQQCSDKFNQDHGRILP